MNTMKQEIRNIAVHESGHAVACWALGHRVKRIEMRMIGDAVLGMTYPRFQPGAKRTDIVSIYFAGVQAVNQFSHWRLHVSLFIYDAPRPTPARLQHSIQRFRFDEIATTSGSDFSGDLGMIEHILQGMSSVKRDRIFSRASDKCRRLLDTHEHTVRRLAQELLNWGRVEGENLQLFRREVVSGTLAGIR